MLTTLHASATTIVDKIRETRRELDMIKRGVHAPSWKDVPVEMLNRAFSQAMYYITRKYDNRGKWYSIPELIDLIAAEPHPSVSWLSEVRAPGPEWQVWLPEPFVPQSDLLLCCAAFCFSRYIGTLYPFLPA